MDRGAWWAKVFGVTWSWTQLREKHFQDKEQDKEHLSLSLHIAAAAAKSLSRVRLCVTP